MQNIQLKYFKVLCFKGKNQNRKNEKSCLNEIGLLNVKWDLALISSISDKLVQKW